MQVQQKRWKVETFSRLDSVLLLSSVNLPGGVLVSPSCHGSMNFLLQLMGTVGDAAKVVV